MLSINGWNCSQPKSEQWLGTNNRRLVHHRLLLECNRMPTHNTWMFKHLNGNPTLATWRLRCTMMTFVWVANLLSVLIQNLKRVPACLDHLPPGDNRLSVTLVSTRLLPSAVRPLITDLLTIMLVVLIRMLVVMMFNLEILDLITMEMHMGLVAHSMPVVLLDLR